MSDARVLLDQVAIVTGGASGIGATTVRLLRAAGARVAIFDIAPVTSMTAAHDDAGVLGRISQPDDIAHVIVFPCKPESRQMTAQTIHVNAGSIAP